MNNEVESAFAEMEKRKLEFAELLNKFNNNQHSLKPKDGWNMLQVLEHVISSEKGTLEYMKRKTQAPASEIELSEEQNEVNSAKLNEALVSENKWKAPAVLSEPQGTQSVENMLIYWNNVRADYQEFLNNLDKAYFDRLIFKHPFIGRIDLLQTIEFLSNHITHHSYQLKRIAKELA